MRRPCAEVTADSGGVHWRGGARAPTTQREPRRGGFGSEPERPPSGARRGRPYDEPSLAGEPASLSVLAGPLLAVFLLASCLLSPRADWDGGSQLPQNIVFQDGALLPLGGSLRPSTPALRGCCGAPTEFRWVFLDGAKEATAGTPFRTRVFALDAQGRQARPSACSELRVGLGLSGRARLSRATSPIAWRNSELDLDIETERAEVVEAEVRIESPDPTADVLLHTSRISFSSGPARGFSFELRPPRPGDGQGGGAGSGQWRVQEPLEATASQLDRFGNRVPVDPALAGALVLRCDPCEAVDVSPHGGALQLSSSGEALATVRGLRPGAVEFWLERREGNASAQQRGELRRQTSLVAVFEDASAGGAAPPTLPAARAMSTADARWREQALRVREEFLHAWRGYRQHAWGSDELQPVSKKGKDTFGGIGATIIDSLTTLWLMGLEEEFQQARDFVRGLDFGRARGQVSVFELFIRAVGGLLGAHALSGQQLFLDRARELGDRLMPAFNTSSGLPWPKCDIATGKCADSGEPTILSEAGSVQLELRCLSEQTGALRFREAGDKAFEAIQSAGMAGLLPVYLTAPGTWPVKNLASKFAMGALADSYYEYLLKQWLQNPREERLKELWVSVMDELPGLLRPRIGEEPAGSDPLYRLIEVAAGGEIIWKMDHLSCFTGGMAALGLMSLPDSDLAARGRNKTWTRVAEGLTAACVELWTQTPSGLSPEHAYVRSEPPFDFSEIPSGARHSFLRPETAESLFYLHRLTGDEKYRQWGKKLFDAMVTHAKVDGGYSSVGNVKRAPTQKLDEMHSFVLAETFKYLYLLFAPAETLDLRRFVLNTEGHPLPASRR